MTKKAKAAAQNAQGQKRHNSTFPTYHLAETLKTNQYKRRGHWEIIGPNLTQNFSGVALGPFLVFDLLVLQNIRFCRALRQHPKGFFFASTECTAALVLVESLASTECTAASVLVESLSMTAMKMHLECVTLLNPSIPLGEKRTAPAAHVQQRRILTQLPRIHSEEQNALTLNMIVKTHPRSCPQSVLHSCSSINTLVETYLAIPNDHIFHEERVFRISVSVRKKSGSSF